MMDSKTVKKAFPSGQRSHEQDLRDQKEHLRMGRLKMYRYLNPKTKLMLLTTSTQTMK